MQNNSGVKQAKQANKSILLDLARALEFISQDHSGTNKLWGVIGPFPVSLVPGTLIFVFTDITVTRSIKWSKDLGLRTDGLTGAWSARVMHAAGNLPSQELLFILDRIRNEYGFWSPLESDPKKQFQPELYVASAVCGPVSPLSFLNPRSVAWYASRAARNARFEMGRGDAPGTAAGDHEIEQQVADLKKLITHEIKRQAPAGAKAEDRATQFLQSPQGGISASPVRRRVMSP